MRKFTQQLFCGLICIYILQTSHAQTRIGIDCNQPIDNTTGAIYPSATTAVVATTCTPWVRVNFILGPWSSPSDQTLHNGKTWKQTYDEIIDGFVQQGIQVYALVGAQIVSQSIGDKMIAFPGSDSSGAAAWKDEYISNFVQVVDYFKDRIRVYESYNEPNNWDNGYTAVVHAKWFALMLQDVYLNVKYFNGHVNDQAWQVTLVSGAVLTMDNLGTNGYIAETYWYGINEWAWSWTHQETGSYPLDAIGMHIYVEQGSTSSATITNAMNQNINNFWTDITSYEGATSKQVWISEFGWQSGNVGYQGQADNLTTSFNLLKNDSRIGAALWFTLSDWPGVSWGIYEMGNFDPSDQKLAFNAFKGQVNCYATNLQATADCDGNVNFNWTNSGNAWLIDVSTDPNFSFFYNKDVSNQTSTNAPVGFSCYVAQAPCSPVSLSFQPGTTYYWRMWNGETHTSGGSFTIPSSPASPTITLNGNTLTSGLGNTYQWYLDGNIITGATSQSYTPLQNGNYTVTITDGNGCSATSAPYNLTSTNLIEVDELAITLYPNPNNGTFTLQFKRFVPMVQIKVVNMLGELVFADELKTATGNYTLNLLENQSGKVVRGVYSAHILTENKLYLKKIVIR